MGPSETYIFGPYRLEVGEGRLLRDGEAVGLRPKVFDTLVALVRRKGRLATKSELMDELWPDSTVEEGNLATSVSALRQALGDSRADMSYIETVPTRGYRFVAAVQQVPGEADTTGQGPPPATPGGAPLRPPAPDREQQIFFTTAGDGLRIAYAVAGDGPPLVKTANWLNHLEFDWRSPVWVHIMRELCDHHTLVRYDERGNGLSDWDVEALSFDAFVEDLERVVEASGVERFGLLGISQGCSVAIAYAVRHPERVERMVLHGGYAWGWHHRMRGDQLELYRGLVEMIRTGWGREAPAFRQLFASIYIPDATVEQHRGWTELQQVSTSPENAARLVEAWGTIDVRELLPRVTVPTLVTHSQRDLAVPFEEGRRLATRIPGARFLPLDSDNHLILEHEAAWPVWRAAVRSFLAEEEEVS